MSRERSSKKGRDEMKRKFPVSLPTGKATVRVYGDGVIMSSSAGWGGDGIAIAETNAVAAQSMTKAVLLSEKATTEAQNRGKQRRGTQNKRTVFIQAIIGLAFDDFPKWWNDHSNRTDSWRHDQMIRTIRDYLITNSPESETGLSTVNVEVSDSELTIGGKSLTRDQLRRIVPSLVTDR